MPTSLTATKIKDTYGQLLHVDGGVTSTPKTVYDGDGTATALKVGTGDVQVNNSSVLTDADIGSTVQAYDADLTAWSGKTAPTGTVVGTSDSQALTNKTISGANNTLSNIGNSSLTNSAITIGSTSVSLGATSTTLTGLSSVTSTAFNGALTGNVTGDVSGNAGTVTNGVYTTGDQTIGGNKTFSSNPILSAGTANGVAYLNGSKVLTTGSAFVFDGTSVGIGTSSPGGALDVYRSSGESVVKITNAGSGASWIHFAPTSGAAYLHNTGNTPMIFTTNGSERMRIDSSGNLGYGTSQVAVNNVDGGNNLAVFAASSTQTVVGGSKTAITIANSNTTTNNQSQLDFATTNNNGDAYWNTSATISCIFGARSGSANYYPAGTLAFLTSAGGVASGAQERMRIDSSGNLLVGQTSQINSGKVCATFNGSTGSGVSLVNSNSGNTGNFINFAGTSTAVIGTISQNGASNVAYNTSSDYRLKENIQPMQNALDVVAQLNPVTYNWKADGSDGQGFIAHELQAVVPDCVTGEKDAVDTDGKPVYQGIDTSFLVATLTKAIQELKAEVDSLKSQIKGA